SDIVVTLTPADDTVSGALVDAKGGSVKLPQGTFVLNRKDGDFLCDGIATGTGRGIPETTADSGAGGGPGGPGEPPSDDAGNGPGPTNDAGSGPGPTPRDL